MSVAHTHDSKDTRRALWRSPQPERHFRRPSYLDHVCFNVIHHCSKPVHLLGHEANQQHRLQETDTVQAC